MHVIVAEAGDAVIDNSLGLDAGRGIPPQVVPGRAQAVVLADLPINLRHDDVLITGAGHDYQTRRGWCDAVPLDELRLAPSALVPRLPDIRARIRAALDGSAPTVEPIDLGGLVEPVWVTPIDQP